MFWMRGARGDGRMVCFIYCSQGTSQTGCSHLASASYSGLVTTVSDSKDLMSTPLIEAKIGQGAVCGCLCPDVSLQLTRALFLRALVQEPPFSYQAPGSQVTGRGRGRWRQWLSCFLTYHHSSRGATQLSFGLWLLSLIFSSPSVWSFLFCSHCCSLEI